MPIERLEEEGNRCRLCGTASEFMITQGCQMVQNNML